MEPPDGCTHGAGYSPCVHRHCHRDSGWFFLMLFMFLLNCRNSSELMSSPASMQASSYDARVYTVCAPWLGERGDKYLRVFKPSFHNGLEGVVDEDGWSLLDHALGIDAGGNDAAAPGHPTGGAGTRSVGHYRARASKLKSLTYKHWKMQQ